MPNEFRDLMTLQEASEEYHRSVAWLYDQLKDTKLTRIQLPGDKKTYVSRRELETLVHPVNKATGQQYQTDQ